MKVRLAKKTLEAVDVGLEHDQGKSYEQHLSTFQAVPQEIIRCQTEEEEIAESKLSALGPSSLGDPEQKNFCIRKVNLSLRNVTHRHVDAKGLRIFARGDREEANIMALLIQAGFVVMPYAVRVDGVDKQFEYRNYKDTFAAKVDAIIKLCPDWPDPEEHGILEVKTMKQKYFDRLTRNGVEIGFPDYYVQAQCYLVLFKLKYLLHVTTNKDTEELYAEIIVPDKKVLKRVNIVLKTVLNPPAKNGYERIPVRPFKTTKYPPCAWCNHKRVCWGMDLPRNHCRTCVNFRFRKGDKYNYCMLYEKQMNAKEQYWGCNNHRYNPDLLAASVTEYSLSENGAIQDMAFKFNDSPKKYSGDTNKWASKYNAERIKRNEH